MECVVPSVKKDGLKVDDDSMIEMKYFLRKPAVIAFYI